MQKYGHRAKTRNGKDQQINPHQTGQCKPIFMNKKTQDRACQHYNTSYKPDYSL
jgi:hypothetical protein